MPGYSEAARLGGPARRWARRARHRRDDRRERQLGRVQAAAHGPQARAHDRRRLVVAELQVVPQHDGLALAG